MKLYSALKPFIIYNQNGCSIPKGEKPGFGEAVFLIAPSKESAIFSLQSKNATADDGFLNYKRSLYKNYMIDFVYKEKIGYKKYLKNNTGVFKKEFNEIQFTSPLHLVSNTNKVNVLKRKLNLLVNLGEWHNVYFQFQLKTSLQHICENYMDFLGNKVNSSDFNEYHKILYVDVAKWFNTEEHKLSLERRELTNPIAILLVTLYKFPEAIRALGNCDILFVNSDMNKIMKVSSSDLIKKNYPKMKQRLMSLVKESCINATSMDENVLDGTTETKEIDNMSDSEVIRKITASPDKMKQSREKIILELKKNLVGQQEDITSEFIEDETIDDLPIETDDDKINEIENIANNYMDEHPELLDEVDIDSAIKEVTTEVKKKYYINEFTPKYSDDKLKEIQRLESVQLSTIGNAEESFKNLESKKIDETDLSDVVDTKNPNIVKSKFVNFDRSYNQKKMAKDIDNAVGQLANASTKVFVIDKQEEDTSTQMDLKKTLTYTLQDENGKKMKLKFDVPIVFDDHFLWIKGNKKLVQHQLVLKPIVKTGDDSVQIVTNYQKMFIRRKGSMDFKTNALLRFLTTNKDEFDVITGNGVATNKKYQSTLEYNILAKKIIQFKIGENLIILDPNKVIESLDKSKIDYKKVDLTKNIIYGIDTKNMKPLVMHVDNSFTDEIMKLIPSDMGDAIMNISTKNNGGKLLMYSTSKILSKDAPLILLLMYFEGFKSVMEKAHIEYEIIPKSDKPMDIDLYEWGLTTLQDGYIKWKRYPTENSLLMNGLNNLPMNLYSINDLESKDTYVYLMTNIHAYANQAFNLDQYKDFMIDPITKEILIDMGYPTDLVSLCLIANRMLKTDEYTVESDLLNMRLRSTEVIAAHTYKAITDAYHSYRVTQHKKNPSNITMKQDEVITRLSKTKAGVMSDYSLLNPVLEASKLHEVTYKGESGTNEEHAMTLDVRAYNESMLGIIGITTSPDSNVGITRQLTLEPNITSTRGYIDVVGKKNVEEMNSANLLTPAELLTPLGVQHDDPARTAMAYKQTMAMVPVEHSDCVLIGNGVEKALPYHLSSDFTVVADDDGQVIEKTDDYVVIQYKNGKYRTIDLSLQIKKNSAAGFYVENRLVCDKKIGDKVKKKEVVAWNAKHFQKKGNSLDVAMKLGPLVKIAIIPEWDIYEDSAPITNAASEKLATTMVMPVTVSLNKDAFVSEMLKVGDHVEAGQSIIKFDDFHEDPDVMEYIQSIREEEREDVIESNSTSKKSHYTGEIVDIKIYTSVEPDELSDSLKKIVTNHWKKIKKKEKFLDNYKNSDDCNFYKSGNLISESASVVQPDYQGKIKGEKVDDGVLMIFYISFKDTMSRGDKLASEFALKSVNSHVIAKGLEPYSEYHPDETIDLITAPLSISARKTPSIFLAMFGNKCLIEAKRHLKDYWENN